MSRDGITDTRELAACITNELRATAELVERVADSLVEPISELATLVARTLEAGNKLLFCGNGGSAADAQHLATEYMIRYRRRRDSLPAIALTTDTSALTAGANDLGFDHVFARQIAGLGRPGDLLIMHSTSGASQNLFEATRVARERGVKTAALLARDGGALKSEVDLAIVIPTESTARAQEMHIAIGHAVAEWVDRLWSSDES